MTSNPGLRERLPCRNGPGKQHGLSFSTDVSFGQLNETTAGSDAPPHGQLTVMPQSKLESLAKADELPGRVTECHGVTSRDKGRPSALPRHSAHAA